MAALLEVLPVIVMSIALIVQIFALMPSYETRGTNFNLNDS